MAKRKTKTKSVAKETDGIFFLKLVLYVVVGAQWLFLTDATMTKQIPLPIGLLIGLYFTTHEHFQIDRKLEYAVLIISFLLGYWSQTGIVVNLL